jgi:hypothetical protein
MRVLPDRKIPSRNPLGNRLIRNFGKLGFVAITHGDTTGVASD